MDKLDGRLIIVKMKFGSTLYGTSTPESDQDFKGVFLPNKEEVYLGKIPQSLNFNTKSTRKEGVKNTKDDVDCEYHSLHYFIKLACKGETEAIDMLHAPDNMIEVTSPIWEELRKNRHLFYTKNLKAFVGYAQKQASKYGIKGSRLDTCRTVLNILYQAKMWSDEHVIRVKDVWDKLPDIEHTHRSVNKNGIKEYEVCGRKIQETQTVGYAYGIIEHYYKAYGERAKLAKENKNIDWKAVSHAIRAGLEVRSILEKGDITFPLPQAKWLTAVKQGELDYTRVVAPYLEKVIEEVKELSLKSNLPEKADRKFWNQFIIKIMEDYYGQGYNGDSCGISIGGFSL